MTKREFLIKYNVASQVAEKAFGKLGLSAKRFTKAYSEDFSDLTDEEYFIRKDFAQLDEAKQAKKDQQGQLLIDDTKEKELVVALKYWKKLPIDFEINHDKFKPVKLEGRDLFVTAVIFEELNGFVFDLSEEEYLEAIEARLSKEDKKD